MIRAVIFDFNGVLVDDESVHFDLFREVLAEEGVTLTPEMYHERYLGYDDWQCLEEALKDAGRSPSSSRSGPVRRKPLRSVMTPLSAAHAVRGWPPMQTNSARAGSRSVAPSAVVAVTDSRRSPPWTCSSGVK